MKVTVTCQDSIVQPQISPTPRSTRLNTFCNSLLGHREGEFTYLMQWLFYFQGSLVTDLFQHTLHIHSACSFPLASVNSRLGPQAPLASPPQALSLPSCSVPVCDSGEGTPVQKLPVLCCVLKTSYNLLITLKHNSVIAKHDILKVLATLYVNYGEYSKKLKMLYFSKSECFF